MTRFDHKTQSVALLCVGPQMKVFNIDGVSSFIWRQIDGKNSVRTILKRVLDEYDATPTRAKRDLKAFLNQLLDMELIHEK